MSFKDSKCLKNRMKLGLALGLADGITEECPAGRLGTLQLDLLLKRGRSSARRKRPFQNLVFI